MSRRNVTVIRSSIGLYALDLGINALLSNLNLKKEFKWIFILDVDEFLPFENSSEIEQFFDLNETHGYIHMPWKNGILSDENQLEIHHDSVFQFSNYNSTVTKLAYNTDRTGEFWIRHGNHFVLRPLARFRDLFLGSRFTNTQTPLYHVPFLNPKYLRDKIETNPQSNFYRKIVQGSSYLTNKYGENWHQVALSDEDLFWFVHNYRIKKEKDQTAVKASDFSTTKPFHYLGKDISFWSDYLTNCPEGRMVSETPQEKRYLNKLRRSSCLYGRILKKHTSIDGEACLRLV